MAVEFTSVETTLQIQIRTLIGDEHTLESTSCLRMEPYETMHGTDRRIRLRNSFPQRCARRRLGSGRVEEATRGVEVAVAGDASHHRAGAERF
jgi:hypothetical protein